MTDVPLCLVQKAGSLYKSKAKRNVDYKPTVMHIFNLSYRRRQDGNMPRY